MRKRWNLFDKVIPSGLLMPLTNESLCCKSHIPASLVVGIPAYCFIFFQTPYLKSNLIINRDDNNTIIVIYTVPDVNNLDDDTELIRKEDIENHCVDGGLWVIIRGHVYDLQEAISMVNK